MKITIISGSIKEGRQSHKVALFLKAKLEERSLQTDLIDLNASPLPFFGDSSANATPYEGNVKDIRNRIESADALLFVSPEYHGSFSGVLKNALDFFWSEFRKKPIGVATASTGRMGGINASVQLQHVILSLGAYPLPVKLLVPEVQNTFNEWAGPLSDTITRSTDKFLDEFLWFADAIITRKKEMPEPADGYEDDRRLIGELVATVEKAHNRKDAKSFGDLFAKDAVFVNAAGIRLYGKDQIYSSTKRVMETFMAKSYAKYEVAAVRFIKKDVAQVDINQFPISSSGDYLDGETAGVPTYTLVKNASGNWEIISGQNTLVSKIDFAAKPD